MISPYHYGKTPDEEPKPVTCDRDILVFKSLVLRSRVQSGENYTMTISIYPSCHWVTACRLMSVDFENHRATLTSDILGLRQTTEGSWRVDEGIHSFGFYGGARSMGGSVFFAVIPKGTEFFKGKMNDLVSKKLLIFDSEKEFMEYKRTHEVFDFVEWRNKNRKKLPEWML